MKKNPLPKPITILVLTLLTTVVWVGLSIYRAVTVKPSATVSEEILKPINPIINTAGIDQIESAIYFEDADIPEIQLTKSQKSETIEVPTETTVPEIEEAPVSSESAENI